MTSLPRVIAVVGPTSSGKTALGIKLAKKLGGEVVSGDSRQVYRGLNLGTGKVTKAEMRGVPHHLLDIATPRQVYNASDFVRDGQQAIAQVLARGHVPIVVGGTGFYIDSLLGRMTLAEVPPNKKLREQLAMYSLQKLQKQLQKLDPVRYQTIDLQNPHRLIRAIEIAKAPKSKTKLVSPQYEVVWIGLRLPADILEKRIQKRLKERFAKGMLNEARRLHDAGMRWKRMEALGLEYRYMARHLQGKITKTEMLQELEKEIVRYAKRQITWFKKNKDIVWFDASAPKLTDALLKLVS